MAALGFGVIHLYGLTECYGPATFCAEQPEWAALPHAEQSHLKARQGVVLPTLDEAGVFRIRRTGSIRRSHDRRDQAAREHGDEGLPEEPCRNGGGAWYHRMPRRSARMT